MSAPSSNFQGQNFTKRAYRPKEFCAQFGICRTQLWKEISAGRLAARKLGRAVIIAHEDAERWLNALPVVK